jgi:acyl-CoA thioesterase
MIGRVVGNISHMKPSSRSFSHLFDTEIISIQKSQNEYAVALSDKWSVREYPNGGYLSAICVRACQHVLPIKSPISLSAHFFNRTEEFKEAVVNVRVLGQSKSSATVSAILCQEDKPRCAFMFTFSSISNSRGAQLSLSDISAPDLPPVEECQSGSDVFRDSLKIANRTEFKLSKQSDFIRHATSLSEKGKSAEYQCWLKFSDNRPVCTTSLSFLADCLPPPILGVVDAHWLPTVEYNVQFWGVPIPDQCVDGTNQPLLEGQGLSPWVRARFSTIYVNNGMLCTDGQIWTEDGSKLLANSRQLAQIIL